MAGKGANHIEVFGRVRPSKRPSSLLQIDYADHAISIHQPKDAGLGHINNQKEHFNFAFSRVFDATTTQDTMFESIAQPLVDSTLEGFNGTIFAYGQVPPCVGPPRARAWPVVLS